MATKVVQRRFGKVETRSGMMTESMENSQIQPLLESNSHESESEAKRLSEFQEGDKGGFLRWIYIVSHYIVQSAKNIARRFLGLRQLVEKLFGWFYNIRSVNRYQQLTPSLTPLQRTLNLPTTDHLPSFLTDGARVHRTVRSEERLGWLRKRLEVPFDSSSVSHQDALNELWKLAYPDRELPSRKSDLWKEMGWQGSDPSTDFRGGGFISLENLIYFAKNYPDKFHRLLHKRDGKRAEWEYPFAVAGINLSYMLTQMLNLQSGKITTKVVCHFVELLEENEMAFDDLYCVAFQILDTQWLAIGASYMEFNEVLKSTRVQLEQELGLQGICSIQDMPSYRMLTR